MIKEVDPKSLLIKELFDNTNLSIKRRCGHELYTHEILVDTRKTSKETLIIKQCSLCNTPLNTTKGVSNGQRIFTGNYALNSNTKGYTIIKEDYNFGVEIECYISVITLEAVAILLGISNNDALKIFRVKGIKNLFDLEKINITNKNKLKSEEDSKSIENLDLELRRIKNICKRDNISLEKIQKCFVFGTDGSLGACHNEDPNSIGLEIKTCILNGDTGINLVSNFLKIFQPKFDVRCGMHVHIDPYSSKRHFEALKSEKETWFTSFSDFKKKFQILNEFYVMSYIYKNMPTTRISNGYANLKFRQVFTAYVNNMLLERDTPSSHTDAISISRWRTLEFRVMEGNGDVNRITHMINVYMDFVSALHYTSREEAREFLGKVLEIEIEKDMSGKVKEPNYVGKIYEKLNSETDGFTGVRSERIKNVCSEFFESKITKAKEQTEKNIEIVKTRIKKKEEKVSV